MPIVYGVLQHSISSSGGDKMATKKEIWEAAKSAVRDEVRKHRPSQRIWTTITPDSLGVTADSWLVWSTAMIDSFNDKQVKVPIAIASSKRRGFRTKTLIEFAQALRDA